MTILNETFGSTGTAVAFFGGQWWLVGLFIIFILALYFFARGFSAEAMALFLFSSILLVTVNGLFEIPSDWIVMVVILVALLVGYSVYNFVTK